ncbi:ketopantoate reductase family protein [Alcanivorax limicola]|uniref:ketopantoate reductase family protein n=1 Tax=Alcanivorax limicola TaxID=2874102 RepID=UPI001CC0A22A|nr:2-dehydropantoate 2-reductase [Alcanivorax limicola]
MSLRWHILGAGNLGSLAGAALQRAGFDICHTGARHGAADASLHRHLIYPDGRQESCQWPGDTTGPITHLLIATKAQDTATALLPVLPRLRAAATLVRLQNGLGSLDGLPLPADCRIIEAISNSGAWRAGDTINVVAENPTWMGDGGAAALTPPDWFDALQPHWPALHWHVDMRRQQWLKLSVNAVINPLTALHDCPNGALCDDPALRAHAARLADEADQLLARLDPDWPNDTLVRALHLARATAQNTSSMRADYRAGRPTEIDYINGWLLRQAAPLALPMPAHAAIVAALH